MFKLQAKEMKYYRAGYYLVKLKPIDFGTMVGKEVYTCSECLNDNLINIWAYPWTTDNNAAAKDAKINFNLTDDHISAIRNYVDKKNNENRIGWINVFSELEDAKEFKNTFFSHLQDIKIIALYFNENETKDILEEFKPGQDTFGEIGLRVTLLKQIEEAEDENETLLGYDLLGIELDGSFHTFYCHDIANVLEDKFQLDINQYGLFAGANDWKPITDYMNNEENGFEPVPWFVAKAKLVTSA